MDSALKTASQVGMSTRQIYNFSDTPIISLPKDVRDWSTILASEYDAKSWQWPALEGAASRETIAVINFSAGTTVSVLLPVEHEPACFSKEYQRDPCCQRTNRSLLHRTSSC